MSPVAASKRFATAKVAPDVLLDSRRALMHTSQGWLAVADIHFGYEVQRRIQGALLPDWGMAQCEQTLMDLIGHHQPQRLILVGDIMDGKSAASATAALLDRLATAVKEIICILGNHDKAALKKMWPFVETHREESFAFSHGHQWQATLKTSTGPVIHITGHEHPALDLCDGAGLRLKLPALVQEQIDLQVQRWILPAFSPWAAGGRPLRHHQRLGLWACAPTRVWQHEG